MGDDKKEDDGKDLALPATSALFAVVAAVCGLEPATALGQAGVQAAAGIASAAATFANHFQRRKKERKAARYVKLYHLLHERVQKLEEKVYKEEEQDLFISVMTSALEDDEEQKAPVYVAALEWMIKAQPPAAHVRILSGAVRDLSYLELYCFLAEHSGQPSRLHQSVLDEVVLRNRLSGAGLSQGAGVKVGADATDIGEMLVKYCDLSTFPTPPEWRERR